MEKCMICETKESFSGKKCKMCSMRSDEKIKFMDFVFCSEKCMGHFKTIFDSADEIMREELLRKPALI